MPSLNFLTNVSDFSPLPPLRTPAPGITHDTTIKYNIFILKIKKLQPASICNKNGTFQLPYFLATLPSPLTSLQPSPTMHLTTGDLSFSFFFFATFTCVVCSKPSELGWKIMKELVFKILLVFCALCLQILFVAVWPLRLTAALGWWEFTLNWVSNMDQILVLIKQLMKYEG